MHTVSLWQGSGWLVPVGTLSRHLEQRCCLIRQTPSSAGVIMSIDIGAGALVWADGMETHPGPTDWDLLGLGWLQHLDQWGGNWGCSWCGRSLDHNVGECHGLVVSCAVLLEAVDFVGMLGAA